MGLRKLSFLNQLQNKANIYHQRKICCLNGYNYRIISKMYPLKREVPRRQAQCEDTVDKQKVRLLIIFLRDES